MWSFLGYKNLSVLSYLAMMVKKRRVFSNDFIFKKQKKEEE